MRYSVGRPWRTGRGFAGGEMLSRISLKLSWGSAGETDGSRDSDMERIIVRNRRTKTESSAQLKNIFLLRPQMSKLRTDIDSRARRKSLAWRLLLRRPHCRLHASQDSLR